MSSRAQLAASLQRYGYLREAMGAQRKLTVGAGRLHWIEGRRACVRQLSLDDLGAAPGTLSLALPATKSKPLSKEEEMLRERTRNTMTGISDLFFPTNEPEYCFVAAGVDLYVHHLPTGAIRDLWSEVAAAHPSVDLAGAKMDVKHSPEDPFRVAFVLRHNLYVAQLQRDAATAPLLCRITTNGTAKQMCAEADYIIQEEFDRVSAHWWSPDGRRILFTVTDVSMLKEVRVLTEDGVSLESFPFPMVGDRNAELSIVVANVPPPEKMMGGAAVSPPGSGGEFDATGTPSSYRVAPWAALRQALPWVEYVSRLDWLNAGTLYVVAVSREQQRAAHIELHVSDIPTVRSGKLLDAGSELGPAGVAAAAAAVKIGFQMDVPWAWVEQFAEIQLGHATGDYFVAHDVPGAGEGGAEPCFSQLWHRTPAPPGAMGDALEAHRRSWRVVSGGAYNIAPRSIVPTGDGSVLCRADIDSMLTSSLCRVMPESAGLDGNGKRRVHRLSGEGECVSGFKLLPDKTTVAYVFSTPTTPPTVAFCSVNPGETGATAARHSFAVSPETAASPAPAGDAGSPAAVREPSTLPTDAVVTPSYHWYTNERGVRLPMMIFTPQGTAPTGGWPMMLYVYGGPHVQLVHGNFAAKCVPPFQAFAAHGVAVAVVDNQACHGLGLHHLAYMRGRMGTFETSDYVAAVREIAENPAINGTCPINASRVGIHGWSYGGYATLLAMSQASDKFKLGWATAPVSDWRLYDTGYTERYMGVLPDDNAGYEEGLVSKYVGGFPDEPNRLFIAQGLTDENVHFSHSCNISRALIAANKPFSMMIYPGERHGLRQDPKSRPHHETSVLQTVLTHL